MAITDDELRRDEMAEVCVEIYKALGVAWGGSPFAAIYDLRKDAERYRWLRDRCPWTMCSGPAMTRLALRLPVGYHCHEEDGNDMDSAIDAAIAAGAA